MTPERKKTINGHLVEEYYWCGKMVVYVDHHASHLSFDAACKVIEEKAEGTK